MDVFIDYNFTVTKEIVILLLTKGCYINNIERTGFVIDIEILEKILKDTKEAMDKNEKNEIILHKFALFNQSLDELSKYKKVVKMIKDIIYFTKHQK
jgi:hypothetical protein